jgi:hypothetical protein
VAKRTPEGYLTEMEDIRHKLSDFLEQIEKGKVSYFKDIALKLRVLYFDKSGTPALLKVISDLFKFNIVVLISLTLKERVKKGQLPASLADGLVFEQVNSAIMWLERGDEEMNVFDAIKRKEVLYGGEYHSYKEIIEVVADKMTAHIDKTIKDKDVALHKENLLIGGLPVAQRAIIDTARTTITLLDTILSNVRNGKQSPHLRARNG